MLIIALYFDKWLGLEQISWHLFYSFGWWIGYSVGSRLQRSERGILYFFAKHKQLKFARSSTHRVDENQVEPE